MSKMIQVWTNSLVGRALSHVTAHLNGADATIGDGQATALDSGLEDSNCAQVNEFADLSKQDYSHARNRIRERFGIVVSIPEELALFATPVTEPVAPRPLNLVSPTDDMLVAGAEALPTSIDNDEARRLAADVFLAMMSRLPSHRYADQDKYLARSAI